MVINGVKITLVAAVAQNGTIGADNRLLWRLKSDMRHFRALTMGKPLIMGRKTYDSIGKPLPGRHTIVISRDPALVIEGAAVVGSLAAALEKGAAIARKTGGDEIIIGGGGEIYAQAMPLADRLEITAVALEPAGDARFPVIDPALWREEKRASFAQSGDDEVAFAFISYLRR
jgi:dihydrofolate reductase